MNFPIAVDSGRTVVQGRWWREGEYFSSFFCCGSLSSDFLLQNCSIKQEGLCPLVRLSSFSQVSCIFPGPFGCHHMTHPLHLSLLLPFFFDAPP